MFHLFPKKPKVKLGKASLEAAAAEKKRQSPLAGVSGAWKKLNSMDRKQAYTFGAIGLVALVGLMMLGSAVGGDKEDFSDFETRGYDLANMPFSSDEAEQYLLASKYPDMQGVPGGLYSEAEKQERQEADMEEGETEDDEYTAGGSSGNYVPGRYYGGSGRGGGSRTNVGRLNSANLKSASGSGMSGHFGPSGDFSNFRNQNKGSDKFNPTKNAARSDARKALQQTAIGSRAAAGLKDNKLANAKKAMIGGNIDGSKAFLNDSGAVNLSEAKGLNLDPNAPISSADMGGLDDALQDANKEAAKKENEKEEDKWWQEMLQQVAQTLVNGLVNMGLNSAQSAIQEAKAARQAEQLEAQAIFGDLNKDVMAQYNLDVAQGSKLADLDFSNKGMQDALGLKESGGFLTDRSGKKVASIGNDGTYSLTDVGKDYTLTNRQAKGVVQMGQQQYLKDNPAAQTQIKQAGQRARMDRADNYVPADYGSSSNQKGDSSGYIKDANGKQVFGKYSRDGKQFLPEGSSTWRDVDTSGSEVRLGN